MNIWTWIRANCLLLAIVWALGTWSLTFPSRSRAQKNCPTPVQGNNAAYNTTCNSPNATIVGSSAFIDASVFGGSTLNLCTVLNGILSGRLYNYPLTGAVIDARGLPGNTGTSMTCTGTPWSGISSPPPSTILLPAGTITIPTTWVLPNGTRVIGEGSTNPFYIGSGNPVPQTIIQACANTGCFSGAAMIQLGDGNCPSSVCTGVTLEDVTLNGSGSGIGGIVNEYSQELSYAKNVTMYQVSGIGLYISGGAQNSGPYANLTYDTGGLGGTASTCASIYEVNGGTRGIHGLTCISDDASATAIKLDSSNNSLEDIRIAGFVQGILVGSQWTATANVLKNVWGFTMIVRGIAAPPTVVEIAGSNVADLVVMGVSNPNSGTNTIWDQVTSTKLTDTAIAMYALGEPASSTNNYGYSRFTTSPNAVTWMVGSGPLNGACAKGSIFSCDSSCSSGVLWACGASNKWYLIK